MRTIRVSPQLLGKSEKDTKRSKFILIYNRFYKAHLFYLSLVTKSVSVYGSDSKDPGV